MNGFQFPEGVEFLGEDCGDARFKVSIPLDADGFFGRECTGCEQHFRVAHEDYEELPDDLVLWCVYCGHSDDHSAFLTEQQRERLMRAASDYAQQLVGQMLDDSFGRTARRSRGSFVRITYRSKPFYPAPLPEIDEERLVRERACESCGLRYAVFGEHRFCPVCGLLPPLTIALDALEAESVRLDAMGEVPTEARRRLQESGVLDRTCADVVENVVGIVEAMADRTFRSLVPAAEEIIRGKGKVFQRLNDFADLFVRWTDIDVRGSLGDVWPQLEEAWAARHVFTHCDGIIDAKYLRAVPSSSLRAGQRLRATEDLARGAIRHAEALSRALARTSAN